ncbi:MAG TPA: DNA topoisomerase (ATP-hydrolyzing) subunit B [Candidatus Paceibacterota bacterium]|nr:DNA topoisomerase (ATP-hydrolyzing) subunit B [Candidatus Paceibacterota bacterium]
MTKIDKNKIKNQIQEKEIKSTADSDQYSSYTAKDIYVLEGLEPVRRRPGMYIGSTGLEGLHHLVWEVVDNSIDEATSGYAKNILVEILDKNKVAITDDGRGIPVDIHPKTKKSALETVMCTLHAGGKFGGQSYKVAGGLHGVGVSVVNALSKHLIAEICRNGTLYKQEYSRGKPITKVMKNGKCQKSGTKITFEPDPDVFKEINFDLKKILDHLREQAYLTPGITIQIKDYRNKTLVPSYTFHFESGIKAFIQYLARDYKWIVKTPFYISQEKDNILIEIALVYIEDQETLEISFANNIHTPEGGMHLTGFRAALTRVLNDYAKSEGFLKEEDSGFSGEDTREGLMAIISIKLKEPQFEGQTKAKLGNPEARLAVEKIMNESFKEYLEINKEDAKNIIEKCLLSSRARQAAKKARENILRKGAFEGAALPGKLADCISRKAENSELFIVEGESAGGSAKLARDRNYQAILPLRGKILNVEKARFDRMMASEEIKSLIIALGTTIGEDFNLGKLRYHKIIIMSDADSDGAHIRTLLLTFFFRYFKPIIEQGYLYIAQPPLYRIQKGKEIFYAYTDQEKDKIIRDFRDKENKKEKEQKNRVIKLKLVEENEDGQILEAESTEDTNEEKTLGLNIGRYKGLGEMNPEQLWETTMDPKKRILKQVTIEDAEEADRLFDILMGEEVLPRKTFIQAYAQKVKNLDI